MKSILIFRPMIHSILSFILIILLAGCGGSSVAGGGGNGCVGATCQGGGGNNGGGPAADAPTLSIAAGDGENTLTLAPPSGSRATTFNVYWSTSPQVSPTTGNKIPNVTSPFIHNLAQIKVVNGTPVFYVGTVASGNSESSPSAVVGGMPGKWTQLLKTASPSSLPPGRDSHTAVYSSSKDRMIVTGGRNTGQSQPLADYWVLLGASTANPTWNPISSTNAPGLVGHTAILNQADQMIVFGGATDTAGNNLTDNVWQVSNADASSGQPQWIPLNTGPSERWGHAAVYDSASDTMIVFGGIPLTGQILSNEVWVLHQTTTAHNWMQIFPSGGPTGRCCMAVDYDAANRRMILFGGFGGSTLFSDLWALTFDVNFSTATWQELTPSGGTALDGRCCGVGLWDGSKFLVFGGGSFNNATDDKIHALVLQSTTFATADGPGGGPVARTFPTAVFAGRFLLFGGSGGGSLNDLWRLE